LKSGSLNPLEPSGPDQACKGIALPFLKEKNMEKQKEYNLRYLLAKVRTT
jgi:hypothetical protein